MELDVLCLLLWSDPEEWLVVLLQGQWSAPPSLTKPLFITSLISLWSQLRPGSALGAWGEALCFFPFVMDLNHPFQTRSQCGSRVICRELCWHWASVCDGRNHSLGTRVSLSVSSTCAVLHVLTQLQLGLTPVPPLAGGETFMSSLSPLLGHPFPRVLGLSSPMASTPSGAGCDSLCHLLMEVWTELSILLTAGGCHLVPELRVGDTSSNQRIWWVPEGSTTALLPLRPGLALC